MADHRHVPEDTDALDGTACTSCGEPLTGEAAEQLMVWTLAYILPGHSIPLVSVHPDEASARGVLRSAAIRNLGRGISGFTDAGLMDYLGDRDWLVEILEHTLDAL